MVSANWRYSSPDRPGKKAIGTNTASSTRVLAITGPVVWVTVFQAAPGARAHAHAAVTAAAARAARLPDAVGGQATHPNTAFRKNFGFPPRQLRRGPKREAPHSEHHEADLSPSDHAAPGVRLS